MINVCCGWQRGHRAHVGAGGAGLRAGYDWPQRGARAGARTRSRAARAPLFGLRLRLRDYGVDFSHGKRSPATNQYTNVYSF